MSTPGFDQEAFQKEVDELFERRYECLVSEHDLSDDTYLIFWRNGRGEYLKAWIKQDSLDELLEKVTLN